MHVYNLKQELVAIRCDGCAGEFPLEPITSWKYEFSGYSVVDLVTLECFHLCRACLKPPFCAKEILHD